MKLCSTPWLPAGIGFISLAGCGRTTTMLDLVAIGLPTAVFLIAFFFRKATATPPRNCSEVPTNHAGAVLDSGSDHWIMPMAECGLVSIVGPPCLETLWFMARAPHCQRRAA